MALLLLTKSIVDLGRSLRIAAEMRGSSRMVVNIFVYRYGISEFQIGG